MFDCAVVVSRVLLALVRRSPLAMLAQGFDPVDVFVFVEVGEDLVLVDVEDQVGEGVGGCLAAR